MFRTALVAFALLFATYTSGYAQNTTVTPKATAGNQQEAMDLSAEASAKAEASPNAGNNNPGNNPKIAFDPAPTRTRTAPLPLTKPVAVVCALPGGKNTKPSEQRIKLAPGQKPLTACPSGSTTYIDFGSSPRRSPVCQQCRPPADAAAIEKEQNDLADAQLRALKSGNKTPSPKIPEQQPSGQPP